MIHYITADLRRIIKRLPHIIALAFVLAILIILIAVIRNGDAWTSVTFTLTVEKYIAFLPLLLGLIELLAVFADDFKAKTMQVAIGIGIPRRQVVLSKFLETAVLALTDLILFTAVCFIAGAVCGAGLNGGQIMEICINMTGDWLSIIGYASFTMILLFFTQSTGPGTLLNILFSYGLINTLIGLTDEIDAIQFLHIGQYTFTSLQKLFITRLQIGSFHFGSFIGIILYILCGCLLSILVFRHRELDF